jgi:probable HAF family extracellular repeat protein
MRARKSMIATALLAGLAAACNDDAPDPAGPSLATGNQAVTTEAVTYTVKNLGTLGGHQSIAYDINNMGQTVGYSTTSAGKAHAFIYQSGSMKDLGALSGGVSEANAVNDAGVVVGYSTLLSGAERAVRWQNGTRKNLGTLGGRNSRATDINGDGVIVGWSETSSGNPHAFVYQNGVMKDLGTLGGKESHAWGINTAGKIVGSSRTASGELHAFAYANGRMQDLGDGGTSFSEATAINSGLIVGLLGAPPDAEGSDADLITGFIYSGGTFKRVNTNKLETYARDINKDGLVVGGNEDVRDPMFGTPDAWVRRTDGVVQFLPELADGSASAEGINSFGTIVGYSEAADGDFKAVIWRAQ